MCHIATLVLVNLKAENVNVPFIAEGWAACGGGNNRLVIHVCCFMLSLHAPTCMVSCSLDNSFGYSKQPKSFFHSGDTQELWAGQWLQSTVLPVHFL